jgi:hypothetical protein
VRDSAVWTAARIGALVGALVNLAAGVTLAAALALSAWNRDVAWLTVAFAGESLWIALQAHRGLLEALRVIDVSEVDAAKLAGAWTDRRLRLLPEGVQVLRRREDDLLLACGHRIHLPSLPVETAEFMAAQASVPCFDCRAERDRDLEGEILEADYEQKDES